MADRPLPLKVFWFRRRSNFGDTLAPVLVSRFGQMDARWSRPESSEAVVIGSIAGRLPSGYPGVVLGVGKIAAEMRLNLSAAHVLGLRGALTLRDSGVQGPVALGDSGLLMADLIGERPAPLHALGVVAHYSDDALDGRYPDAHHIDVTREPLEVIRDIAACERIVSSSLHGLITADALGIPRRWEPSDRLIGGHFKFADYASGLGITLEPDIWGSAPRSAVDAAVTRLRDAFGQLPSAVAALPPARLRRSRLWQVIARFGHS